MSEHLLNRYGLSGNGVHKGFMLVLQDYSKPCCSLIATGGKVGLTTGKEIRLGGMKIRLWVLMAVGQNDTQTCRLFCCCMIMWGRIWFRDFLLMSEKREDVEHKYNSRFLTALSFQTLSTVPNPPQRERERNGSRSVFKHKELVKWKAMAAHEQFAILRRHWNVRPGSFLQTHTLYNTTG